MCLSCGLSVGLSSGPLPTEVPKCLSRRSNRGLTGLTLADSPVFLLLAVLLVGWKFGTEMWPLLGRECEMLLKNSVALPKLVVALMVRQALSRMSWSALRLKDRPKVRFPLIMTELSGDYGLVCATLTVEHLGGSVPPVS